MKMFRQDLVFSICIIALAWAIPLRGAALLDTANFEGHLYHLIAADSSGTGIDWLDAEAFAITLGGHLVTVNDAAEDQFIFDTWGDAQVGEFLSVNSLLIGFNDFDTEGMFVWLSGEPVTYTNWLPGAPNNRNSQGQPEDVGSIIGLDSGATATPGKWNDIHEGVSSFNDHPIYGVVELIPSPLGDMNLSGMVDFDDIAPFVLGLTNEGAYVDMYGVPPELYGDIDGSGFHDFDDIDDFADILLSGELQAVPEPGALLLALTGVLGLLTMVRRGSLHPR